MLKCKLGKDKSDLFSVLPFYRTSVTCATLHSTSITKAMFTANGAYDHNLENCCKQTK